MAAAPLRLGLAAEPGGQLGVRAGVGRDLDDRGERDAPAAGSGGRMRRARTSVRLRFAAVPAARTLLSFGGNVEVVSPPEVRADLASAAADVVARYGPGPGGRVV